MSKHHLHQHRGEMKTGRQSFAKKLLCLHDSFNNKRRCDDDDVSNLHNVCFNL